MANSKQFLDYEGLKHVIEKLNTRNDGKYISSILKGEANGVASLDAKGRIPVEQLGNLDVTVFKVVTKLPESDIKPYIYLVKNADEPENNKYIEWVYVADENRWEKLGEYKADIDLSPYAKLEGNNNFTGINNFSAGTFFDSGVMLNDGSTLMMPAKKGDTGGIICTTEEESSAGKVWATDGSVKDLSAYDDLVATTWPFKISSFSSSAYVLEIGNPAALTFKWGYQNDKHTVKTQTLTLTGATTGSKSYSVAAGTLSQAASTADLTTLCGQRQDITAKIACTSNANLPASSQVTVRAIHPKYYGVLTTKTIPTAATDLTKKLEYGAGATFTGVTLNNGYFIYLYPAEDGFNKISSIKDVNNFDVTNSFESGTTTIGGVTYNYQIMKDFASGTSLKFVFA